MRFHARLDMTVESTKKGYVLSVICIKNLNISVLRLYFNYAFEYLSDEFGISFCAMLCLIRDKPVVNL